MIIFTKIKFKNFLSFGNNWMELSLSDFPTTLIVGKNGHGKSTLISAIIFGLFGKSNRGKKGQLINSINKRELEVHVEFQKGKNQYRIERGISPNIFKIFENDVLINQDAQSKDYQSYLEKEILNLNYKTFHQTIVIAASSFVPFMKLPLAGRREVIEDILDISIFSKMKLVLKHRLDDNKSQLFSLEKDINFQKEKIKQHTEYVKQLQNQNEEQEKQILQKIKDKKKEKLEINRKLKEKVSKLIELEKVLKQKQKEYDEKYAKVSEQETHTKTKIKDINKKLQFFENHDTCPTCFQTISNDLKIETKKKEKQQLPEIKTILEAIDQEKKWLTSANMELQSMNTLWNTLKWTEIQELQFKSSALDSEIPELEDEVMKIRKKESINIESSNSLYEKLIELEELRTHELKTQTYLETIRDLLKDDGIKSGIIRKYLSVINSILNKYLNIMDFFVNFQFDENFNETVLSRYRDSFTFDSFSEGEKARLNLALLFTFRHIAKMKNSTSCNLLFLDEVFDSSLDEDGLTKLVEILDSEGENYSNIFVISHSENVQQMEFSRKFLVAKPNNFSEIREFI
jgi:DNA repair exonuclease SbcCD ATPase subunit